MFFFSIGNHTLYFLLEIIEQKRNSLTLATLMEDNQRNNATTNKSEGSRISHQKNEKQQRVTIQ